MSDLFNSPFYTSNTISPALFLACIAVSLLAGCLLALAFCWRECPSRSFVFTLFILPAIVCVAIMMVNGNVGTGVAVAGVFGLVRFRSVPGTAREISAVFIAMAAGLIFGMGYLAYGLLFTAVLVLVVLGWKAAGLDTDRRAARERTLRITIPENLDYPGVFDDLLREYTRRHELTAVKTTNMGSLFRLTYRVELADRSEKEFLDALRTRNGNLEVSLSLREENDYAL